MERDGDGKARCEFYDGKVLSGKYAEFKERGDKKNDPAPAAKYQEYKIKGPYPRAYTP